ncbi:hypothetical protein ACO2J1_14915 [Leptospira interrogans]|uniref:Uncharacterized protein n=2 Tax=Leptospira interrogans TaxID=173 RepID=A0A067YBA9_LEPIR|nr:hypothetical protein [Leptospira interrogans]AGZ84955.1 hypothetical protein [Leptospira interrogans serovar Canicola]EKO70247.1 hypothetical protein LEP1GSC069_1500 [Leptospira interrogans serovar Canicola str. Fiocruz LV133]EMK23222.1 hypothetical protein LEP1GSC075_1277 [Leptospira interrogans str. Kito]EMN77835.1 hypothetical protein LEP1GSC102_1377 [Leptospira interrogans str. UI 09600]MCR8628353.1 hypothetical protein [Leptospira interrogans serovar Canicola]
MFFKKLKLQFLIILSMTFSITVSGESNYGKIPSSIYEQQEILISIKQWENVAGASMKFSKNGTVSFVQDFEPPISGEGIYSLVDGKIKVSFKKAEDNRLKGAEYICSFEFKEHDYLPMQYISCREPKNKKYVMNLFNPESHHLSGYKFLLEGQKMELTDRKLSKVNFDSFFREKPDVNSKSIPFTNLSSEECMQDILTDLGSKADVTKQIRLPKGFHVEVIARSEESVQIDKWNNHWYFVVSSLGCYGNITTKYGWIFGQFLDMK